MRVLALTGTPGTGKTSVARELRKMGLHTINIRRFARSCGALGRYIKKEDSFELDIEILADGIARECSKAKREVVVVEGHLSHLIPCVTQIVVLRCAPSVLCTRLRRKRWRVQKIWENVEAEAIDLILIEALEIGKPVSEIDTTNTTPDAVAGTIIKVIDGEWTSPPGRINWSEDFLNLVARKENVRKLQKKGRPLPLKDCETL
ncbi:MAG: adenylate kinase family protein [Thermoplasmata archaeon]|nr:adenylate kinase family protein [Thermoplasmata archaeon]